MDRQMDFWKMDGCMKGWMDLKRSGWMFRCILRWMYLQ